MTITSTGPGRSVDDAVPPPARPHPSLPPAVPSAPGSEKASETAARSVITHARSMSLAVPDLASARAFYEDVWGLYAVAEETDLVWLGTVGSPEPFVLRLRATRKTRSDAMAFGAVNAAGVDRLASELGSAGVQLLTEPGQLDQPGGGYGFRFFDPEGRTIEISSDLASKPFRRLEARESVPRKLSHIVINTPDVPAMKEFYIRFLGFRLSDWLEDRMAFLRCSAEHHSLAIAYHRSPNFNHVSFEMADVESYMRGTGRLLRSGYTPLWGPGRHSAGDNVYSYFRGPGDFVIEYTTELERVTDEDAWVPRVWPATPDYADRWGTAGPGSDLFALGGQAGPDAGNWEAPPV